VEDHAEGWPMNRDADRAGDLLIFYIAKMWEAAGLKWDSDNDNEIRNLVDHLISAAKTEVTA
jgi:hypothetical protein